METYLIADVFWKILMLLIFFIGFIFGYLFSKDSTEEENKITDFSDEEDEETDFPLKETAEETITLLGEELKEDIEKKADPLDVIKTLINSLLIKLAIYNTKADRINSEDEVAPAIISILNYHDCGICIWDEAVDNPTALFDSTSISIQFKNEELRIYPAGFSFFYRITENHYPPEPLKEMAKKLSELAKKYYE